MMIKHKVFSIIYSLSLSEALSQIHIYSIKKIPFIEKMFMLFTKMDHTYATNLTDNRTSKMYIYSIFLNPEIYYLILKHLMIQNIQILILETNQVFKRSKLSFLYLFDYEKQKWDHDLFDLNEIVQKIKKENKLIHNINESKNYSRLMTGKENVNKINRNIDLKEFYSDLRYFNALNNIGKKIIANRNSVIKILKKVYSTEKINKEYLKNLYESLSNREIEILKNSIVPKKKPITNISNKKRIILKMEFSDSRIIPLEFIKKPVFQSLFPIKPIDGWAFGGNLNFTLIFEYEIPAQIFFNEKSNSNKALKKIKADFKEIDLEFYEIKRKSFFFNDRKILPVDKRIRRHVELKKPKIINLKIDNPNELNFNFESLVSGEYYQDNLFTWEFWQIIGYTYNICVFIEEIKEELVNQLIGLIEELPAGKICYLEKGIVILLHLRENLLNFFPKIRTLIGNLHILKYRIFPVIPMALLKNDLI